ncbi:hypothetical protein C723_3479 [Christiangramia flava JLT2011]|uniref:Uncharacterized protein n=1 Tax=Christiangramia flava JLT2011 TaxID=1229726 RepID=A0A1L7I4I7_9FLAO|nr:hypothetical protein GRFL_1400 [Christiangramia flava JLT2011]OSS37640.1 hypothetical protein C723_3479 [Christiangramia flava JLT2011]
MSQVTKPKMKNNAPMITIVRLVEDREVVFVVAKVYKLNFNIGF